jgi:AcrR family transcriptional regulator
MSGQGLEKSRKDQYVAATQKALLSVARTHFGRHGYSGAEIARIAADARVTSGAIYHHFGNKQGLFLAVAEDLEAEILAASRAVNHAEPWQQLQLGFEMLVDTCASPVVQRIIFIEAPQVIGPDAWRKIELRYAYGALMEALTVFREAKMLKPYPLELVARTLLALLHETSAEVVRSKRDPKVRQQISELIAGVFGLFHSSAT